MRERERDAVANVVRHQTLEPRLHYPDQVVGRHRVEHSRIEERNHLPRASYGVRILPRRNADCLLLFLVVGERIHLY